MTLAGEARKIRASLQRDPPRAGEPRRAAEDVERLILPGITHWQSPNFSPIFPRMHLDREFSARCFPRD